MREGIIEKVMPHHLKRKAFLYILQSTMRQTHDHISGEHPASVWA